MRKQSEKEALVELEAIRPNGIQMLVDTDEIFVRSRQRFPSVAPLSVQILRQLLPDDTYDWTLAYEEMQQARRLAKARAKARAKVNKQLTEVQCPGRSQELQDLFDRLLDFCNSAPSLGFSWGINTSRL